MNKIERSTSQRKKRDWETGWNRGAKTPSQHGKSLFAILRRGFNLINLLVF